MTTPHGHITFADLVAWGERNDLREMERRATDVGWAYLVYPLDLDVLDLPVDEQPIGWGPYVVVKSTRQVWRFGSGGGMIFSAESEDEFNRALREWGRGQTPVEKIPAA